MAYLHEMALNDAVKRLRILGQSSHRHQKNVDIGEEAGAGMGEAFGNALRKPGDGGEKAMLTRETPGAKQAIASYAVQRGSQDANLENELRQSAKTQDHSVYYDALGPQHDPAVLPQKLANQETSENTAFGGRYTPAGLESTMKQADANGNDRLRMRSMIRTNANPGMGGSLIPGSF